MPAPEFRFGMTLSGGAPDTTRVLMDVFRSVLAHVGVKGEAGDRMVEQVMTEYRKWPEGQCTLRFTAHAGEIEIALSKAGRDFHASCPVPVR